ncbi:MAG: hypothetical protein HQ498_14050 [Pseudohongiella sp.]|nr:hypothetical protein [Pseudohongiella sp.]
MFTERFSLTVQNNLRYEFTIVDETTWSKPRSAVINYSESADPIFEYACHEGNY